MGSAEAIASVNRNPELTHAPRTPGLTLAESTNPPTVTTKVDPINPRFLPFKPNPTPPTEAQIIGLTNLYMKGDYGLPRDQAIKKTQIELNDNVYCIDVSETPALAAETVHEAEPVLIFSVQKQQIPEKPELEKPTIEHKPIPRFIPEPAME